MKLLALALVLVIAAGFKIDRIVGINPSDNRKFQWLYRLFRVYLDDFNWTQYFVQAKIK